ncbi:c-type cytochrome [Sorangium sp. So ce1000]|uniref:c-type cytochrome n=1 Tax=Sorangium sp. So ce1000 TaxID=3133325 RepID=UPI003F5F5B2D
MPRGSLVHATACGLGPARILARHLAALLLGASASSLAAACAIPADRDRAEDVDRDAAIASRARRATQGAELYGRYCALCHGRDARGYAADHAPSLVSETFLATATNAFLARSVREGRPGTAMGAYGRAHGGPLGNDEVDAIIDFLRWPGPSWAAMPDAPVVGDPERGEVVYNEMCQPCHGTKASRGQAVHLANPGLLRAATDAFLREAIVHGRPGTPMMPFAGRLDDRDIDNVVALLRSWASASAPPAWPAEIPQDMPLVIHPEGPTPRFTLRMDRFVSAAQVKEALEAKSRIVILDARTPAEWLNLRIPGSVPAPYHDFSRLDGLENDGTWVVAYCACPHHASGIVVDELRRRGFSRTAVLDEGILRWKQLGYPVEERAPVEESR